MSERKRENERDRKKTEQERRMVKGSENTR